MTSDIVVKGWAVGGDVIHMELAATAGKTVTITEFAGTNTVFGSTTLKNIITGGSGADAITGGSAADTIVGGGGADVIIGGGGADVITVSGTTATIKNVADLNSGANTSTTIQTSELTSTFDVIKGLVAGDKIDLSYMVAGGTGANHTYVTADLVLAGTNLAATDGKIVFTSGTYDATAGTFIFAANGADTAVTYDTNGTGGGVVAGETIILVGFHAASTTTAALGIITLA